jgi:hypothetical protein
MHVPALVTLELTLPSGQVVSPQVTPVRLAVVKMAWERFAMVKLAPERSALVKLPLAKLTSVRLAPDRSVERLVIEARRAGRQIKTIGLARRDIVEYLDDSICRDAAPDFPGWSAAVDGWLHSDRTTPFKTWTTETFGLRLDRKSIRRLAAECFVRGLIPAELSAVMKGVISWADRQTPPEPP